jgi:hypothetical protein
MATPGQPTSYNPEHSELRHDDWPLDATNEELASFSGVTRCIANSWIATHPDAAKAVHGNNLCMPPAGDQYFGDQYFVVSLSPVGERLGEGVRRWCA